MRLLETPTGLDELIAEATNRYRELVSTERQTVTNYWEFGRLLNRIRPNHLGDWMEFLKSQGWCYSRVKRAARIYATYESAKHCQDLTLMDALGYKDTSVLPPRWKCDDELQEDTPQPEGEEQPEVLSVVEPPIEASLTVDGNDDGSGDVEDDQMGGYSAAAEKQLAESLGISEDEYKKAYNYIASFDDPLRASSVLNCIIIDMVRKWTNDLTSLLTLPGRANPKIAFGLLTPPFPSGFELIGKGKE
ncbi:MAG: hypothetical protein ABSG67_17195 [Thermoguttaceae bacterium]|jgi:hypothetical protein